MKDFFSILTERRIQEAIARGDDKNLSGAGNPIKIENLNFIPRKIRAAYIVLKNSGYLDQPTRENNRFLPPTTDEFNSPYVRHSISQQELAEKVFYHNIMMDSRRRR